MTVEEPQGRRGIGRFVPALLWEAPFRRFWIGQTISALGDQVTYLALPIVAVLVLNANATQMGLLTAIGLLPHLLFSLPAGIWLDRVRERRRLMILADIGRAMGLTLIPLAFLFHWLSIELLFAVAFLVGTLAVMFDISWNTFFVAVAKRDQFVQANSLLSGSRSMSSVAGPALGGVLIQILTAPITILVDALSFLGSAIFLGRIHAPEPPIDEEPGTVREQLRDGMSFIARDKIVRGVLLSVATVNLFNFCYQALFILYATVNLGVEPGILGLVLGAGAVGSVVGALVAGRVGRKVGIGRAYLVGLILYPAPLILVPLAGGTPILVLTLLFLSEFLAGLGVMILDINAGAMLLARTPDRIRGRSAGTFRFVNMGVRPIGAVIGGLLGAAIGIRETLFIVTVAQLSGVLWLIRSPILGLKDLPASPE
jgi:MFS family permease